MLLTVAATTNLVVKHFELPLAKVTVRVVDEDQRPVEKANVSLGFGDAFVEGLTDANGLFTGEGRCNVSGMGSTIKKNAYYLGSAPIPRFEKYDEILNRWKPWNEIYTAILRPIVKPVALYAKSEWIEIPAIGRPCGYDLEKGDWVSPYGAGMISDLIFNLEKRYASRNDFDVKVEVAFNQPLDGIQEIQWPEIGHNSIFKWPREAPENGYNPNLRSGLMNDSHGYHATASEKQWYFFRVRTVEQDGKIVSANYGKIKGGIELAPSDSKTCLAKLTYYYNPASLNRNLEWDTKRNLFVNLSWEKTPNLP
jgi:hypothetical protein